MGADASDIGELDGVSVTHRRVVLEQATGCSGPLSLHVVTAGPEDGVPVVLLHGFPDFWYGWRAQIPVLAHAGFRVIVPDQRGYTTSDKPRGWRPYCFEHLAGDVLALQDTLCGGSPVHLVGHDWGGGLSWGVAARYPGRIRSLTVLNCPRPSVLFRSLLRNPRQLRRSWYMLAFQIPGLAERSLARGGAVGALRRIGAPGAFTEADIERYRAACTLPAMRGGVSWYRAAIRRRHPDGDIDAPVLLVWGTADPSLGEELAEPSLSGCSNGRLERVPGAGHWVQLERPEVVSALLCEHLGSAS